MLGWIVSDENQHTFRVTLFGKYVASYFQTKRKDLQNQILQLISFSFINLNYRHPQIHAYENLSVKPFWGLLHIFLQIENFITKDEFNFFILTLENDDNTAINEIVKKIRKARTQKGFFISYKNDLLKKRRISANTASNYTRIPLSFLKAFNVLKKEKIKNVYSLKHYLTDKTKYLNGLNAKENTEVLCLSNTGKLYLSKYGNSENIKFKRVLDFVQNKRILLAVLSLFKYYEIENLSDYCKFFQSELELDLSNFNTNIFAFPYQLLKNEDIELFENLLKNFNRKYNLDFFKPFDAATQQIEWYGWDFNSAEIEASLIKSPKILVGEKEIEFGCINCRPATCFEYTEEELKCSVQIYQEIPDKNPNQVCPTNAITFNADLFPILDYNKCVDCSICISRCKYGAIHYEDHILKISQTKSKSNLKTHRGTQLQAQEYFKSLNFNLKYSLDNNYMISKITDFFVKVKNLKKDEFYPLVRNLLREIHLKAKLGKGGDTQWRYDAIIIEPLVMPVEIKSPKEDYYINPSSIRQAIENSITIEASHSLVKKATSAVIALMYSSKRSASENMLKDAQDLHNIRILLISVIVLAYLNLKDLENKFTIKDVEYLFTNTIGTFDDIAIKEFWINYLARREELEALLDNAYYADIKDKVKNLKFNFQQKLEHEFKIFDQIYRLIKSKK